MKRKRANDDEHSQNSEIEQSPQHDADPSNENENGAAEEDKNVENEDDITMIEKQFSKVCSIVYQGSKLGVAYYDKESGEMFWSEIWETQQFSSLEFLLFQIQPTMIIVPSKSDPSILQELNTRKGEFCLFV